MNIIKIEKNNEVLALFQTREGYLVATQEEELFIEFVNGAMTSVFIKEEIDNAKIEGIVESFFDKAELPFESKAKLDVVTSSFDPIEEGKVIYEAEAIEEHKVEDEPEEVVDETNEMDIVEEVEVGEAATIKVDVTYGGNIEASNNDEQLDEVVSLFEEDNVEVNENNKVDSSNVVEDIVEEVKVSSQTKSSSEPATKFPKYFGEDKDEEITEFLKSSEVSQSVIDMTMKLRKLNRDRVKNYPQNVVDRIETTIEYTTKSDELNEALAMMAVNAPISFIGPTGTGKSTLTRIISTILNYPIFLINGSEDVETGEFVGEYEMKEANVITAKDGEMTLASKYGGMLVVDEINFIPAGVLANLNPFSDDQGKYHNPFSDEIVKNAFETRFVCSMNIGNEYEGTMMLNRSLSARLVPIYSDYKTREELVEIFKGFDEDTVRYGAPAPSLIQKEQIIKLYASVTVAAKNGELPEDVGSLMRLKNLFKLAGLLGVGKVIEKFILSYDDTETRSKIIGVVSNDGLLEEVGLDPVDLNRLV